MKLRRRAFSRWPHPPVFLDLTGKRAVVAGGSDGAGWKAELLWKTQKRSIPLPAASASNDRS
jgi:siroheme synthase (precorrin-2 oxidase/ferrochelatase)